MSGASARFSLCPRQVSARNIFALVLQNVDGFDVVEPDAGRDRALSDDSDNSLRSQQPSRTLSASDVADRPRDGRGSRAQRSSDAQSLPGLGSGPLPTEDRRAQRRELAREAVVEHKFPVRPTGEPCAQSVHLRSTGGHTTRRSSPAR